MTDPLEQARERLAPVDREPDWQALRRDTLDRVAVDRAREQDHERAGRSRRWTALVAAAAVAAVVGGVLGVTQLTDRDAPEPPPAATTPLDRLPGDEVLDALHRTVVDGPEPLAGDVTLTTGYDERTRIRVSRDSVVLTTERYTYAEQGAPGEARRATFVDHARRVWLATDDVRESPTPFSLLPARLRAVVTTDLLGPLLDPAGWRSSSAGQGSPRPDGRLVLDLVPAATPKPTRDPVSLAGGDPDATHSYVVDPDSRLAVRVRVELAAVAGVTLLDGRITWSPATEVRLYDLVPSGYQDLSPGPA
ncbi:hypothetical protein [Nocardioides lijunqiniae]|uniref:hypothetical protein n=1 Tax=Nocardioides lijunqiniae TaxID=2760832 RepID=UPI001878ACF3|nr:hypothetical protein [Nocardioides lijunqiniae]